MLTSIFFWIFNLVIASTGTPKTPLSPVDETMISSLSFDGTNYTSGTGNLTKMNSFDDAKLLPGTWVQEYNAGYFSLTNLVKKTGRFAARIELNSNDADVSGSKRCEISMASSDAMQEGWYGYAQYFPSSYVSDSMPELAGQWHDQPDFNLGEDYRSPPISMWVQNDTLSVHMLYAVEPVNTNLTHTGHGVWPVGKAPKDQWINWVWHIKFSYQSDGILQVWKNGVKVLDYTGPNSYNDAAYPYFKIGLYKWPWKETPGLSQVTQRVLYYDEVRVGNANSNFVEVSPK